MRYKIYNDVQNNPDTIKLLPPRNAKKLGAVVHRTALLKNLSYSPDINTAETLAIWLHSVFCMLFINNTHRSGFSSKIQNKTKQNALQLLDPLPAIGGFYVRLG